MVYIYLIKLTLQKDAYLILTRKCFTIAMKTIQLSSHITQHDEFIKATFSSEIFFETNNIFAIKGKKPFLFHYVLEDKKLNRVKLHSVSNTQLNKFPTSVQHQTLYLNYQVKNGQQALFQIILTDKN